MHRLLHRSEAWPVIVATLFSLADAGDLSVDTMVMVNVDVAVVDSIVKECLPDVHATLQKVEETDFFNPLHVHVPKWLIPLFSTDLPSHTLFRLWDILFTEGSHVLICASVAVIETIAEPLAAVVMDGPGRIEAVQELFQLEHSADLCDCEGFIARLRYAVRVCVCVPVVIWVTNHVPRGRHYLILYPSQLIDRKRQEHSKQYRTSTAAILEDDLASKSIVQDLRPLDHDSRQEREDARARQNQMVQQINVAKVAVTTHCERAEVAAIARDAQLLQLEQANRALGLVTAECESAGNRRQQAESAAAKAEADVSALAAEAARLRTQLLQGMHVAHFRRRKAVARQNVSVIGNLDTTEPSLDSGDSPVQQSLANALITGAFAKPCGPPIANHYISCD
eukprot:COSAG05_NODE_41_length_26845_cov_26.599230_19_plen_395_part_00